MCSLHFENNLLIIEGVRFTSISKKTPLSKLSFAFVSLALPLLVLSSCLRINVLCVSNVSQFENSCSQTTHCTHWMQVSILRCTRQLTFADFFSYYTGRQFYFQRWLSVSVGCFFWPLKRFQVLELMIQFMEASNCLYFILIQNRPCLQNIYLVKSCLGIVGVELPIRSLTEFQQQLIRRILQVITL